MNADREVGHRSLLKKVTLSMRRVEKKMSKDLEAETAYCVYGKVEALA